MKLLIIGGMCVALLVTGSLYADTTFTGAVSNLWSNPDNWSDGLPDAADKASFADGQFCLLDYDAGAVKQIAMEGGGTDHLRFVDGAALTAAPASTDGWVIVGYGGGLEEPHLLEVLGGVLNADHRMKIGFQGRGMLVVDYSGVVNINAQHFSVGDATNGDGRVELRGGALNLNDNDLLFNAGGPTSKASMDFSGGLLTWDFTDAGLALINDRIADGTITAYGGVGTVITEVVDDVLMVKGQHPMNPVPGDGDTILPGNITLDWTVAAGRPVDVWLGTKADLSDFAKVVDKQVVTSTVVATVVKQRYFWAVDTYAAGATEPDLGPVFDFLADNIAPRVKASADITTWLDNGSVQVAISGTVTDSDPTTVAWTVVSQPDDPDSPDAVIADAAALNTTVTLSALGEYVLQLEADDGEYQGADTMMINVYANSCLAAQSLPGYVPIPGDLNLDCVVDQTDIDLLLEQWLNCNGLECPDIDPVDPKLP